MGIIGVLWVVLIVLKALGVALVTTSWLWVILWPIPVVLLLFLVLMIFGVTIAGFASFSRA